MFQVAKTFARLRFPGVASLIIGLLCLTLGRICASRELAATALGLMAGGLVWLADDRDPAE